MLCGPFLRMPFAAADNADFSTARTRSEVWLQVAGAPRLSARR
jgi:hypothetical protein